MSRPAKKYPFRVFLLTLHDDWHTELLAPQHLWTGRSHPHVWLSPRCRQRGWEESRLIWRWCPRSWRTDASHRSWWWSWTSSKFAYTHTRMWQYTQNTLDGKLYSQRQSKHREAYITLTLDSERNFRTLFFLHKYRRTTALQTSRHTCTHTLSSVTVQFPRGRARSWLQRLVNKWRAQFLG